MGFGEVKWWRKWYTKHHLQQPLSVPGRSDYRWLFTLL